MLGNGTGVLATVDAMACVSSVASVVRFGVFFAIGCANGLQVLGESPQVVLKHN